MERILHRYSLWFYIIWSLLDIANLYFGLPFEPFLAPLIIPFLILYLFLRDESIGKPLGKFVYYIGLFLAILGDVFQLVIDNPLFFSSSICCFLLMNCCYGFAFCRLNPAFNRKPWVFAGVFIAMLSLGYYIMQQLGPGIQEVKWPVMFYTAGLAWMLSMAVHGSLNPVHRKTFFRFFIPGAFIFMVQNVVLAVNLFNLGSHSRTYAVSVTLYATAQFLIARGILEAYSLRKHRARMGK
jgi:uncharacterized membrane protein YhhN